MTSQTEISPADARGNDAGTAPIDMRASRFDLLSGFSLTLVLFVGVIVAGLFLLWTLHRWATQEEIHHSRPTRTEFVDASDEALGEFAVPSADEYQALQEPSLDTTLVAISDAVSETAAALDALSGTESAAASPPDSSLRGRHPAPGEPDDVISWFDRWQLNFASPSNDPDR